MQPLTLLLASLAVYRLARMIAMEEGPFSVFLKLRGLFPPKSWVGRGLECALCVGVWVALPVTIMVTVLGDADVWLWPLTWFALAGVQTMLHKWEQKR